MSTTVPAPNSEGLALYLGTEDGSVNVGAPEWVRLEIHNQSDEAARIIPVLSPALGVVEFMIEEDGGQLITIPNIRAYTELNEEHPVVVLAGQYYGSRIDLAHYYTLKGGHSYRVFARYTWRPDGPAPEQKVWRGVLVSNPITIKVVG